MPKFIPYDYNQNSMVVINYLDQLVPGTFEYAIHHLIGNKLDLSVFYPKFKNDEGGRPAYDPAILLKIILFGYSRGITSSRDLEWQCQHNILFKALCCDRVPHFTTIAEFISSRSDEIESLFEQVLLICDEQGLLGHELFAIDGCKMRSNASKEWSGTFKELTQKREKIKRQIRYHLNAHKQQDKHQSRHDEQERRRQQTLATLNQAYDRIDQFLKSHSPRMGQGKIQKEVKSNITDNESAKMKTAKGTIQGYNGVAAVDKKHQIIIDAQAFGEGQEHHTLQPILDAVSRRYRRLKIHKAIYKSQIVVTADTGFANERNMQYLHDNKINAYIPDNQFRSRDPRFSEQKNKYGKRQQTSRNKAVSLIPANEFKFDQNTMTCVCPSGQILSFRHQGVDRIGNQKAFFEGKLLQCRHCEIKSQCMKSPQSADHRKGNGRQVSFIIKNNRKVNYTDWMKLRVDSEEGKRIYSHRMSTVEPVFGNIGTNKGLNRFTLRGKRKVQGQWQLYCLVHNIEKIMNYGSLAA
jgi:transposase